MPKFNPKIGPKLRKKFPKHLFETRPETEMLPKDFRGQENSRRHNATYPHTTLEKLEKRLKREKNNMMNYEFEQSKKMNTKKYSKKMPWRNN